MHKQTSKYLFLITVSILFASNIAGCKEDTPPICIPTKNSRSLSSFHQSFLFYNGTETLVFIDLKNNRDTVQFKGSGIEIGVDTLLKGRREYVCTDTTFLEYKKIDFINKKNHADILTLKINMLNSEDEFYPYINIKNSISNRNYSLELTFAHKFMVDSLNIDEKEYGKSYKIYQYADPYEGDIIFFNKEYGIIDYKDAYRNLVIKAIKP